MNTYKTTIRVALAAFPLLFSIAFATPAQADISIYHGAICQPYWGSQAGDFVTRSNGFQNWTSSNRSVTCPIDRQIPWYNGSSDTLIYVYLYNYSGGSTSCSAHAKNRATGSTYDSYYASAVTASGNQYVLLRVKGSGTMYSVSCSLSPNSYIRSFYVSEPE